jgi:hypothetical protein
MDSERLVPCYDQSRVNNFAWIFSDNIFAELSAKKAMPATKSKVIQWNGRSASVVDTGESSQWGT